MFTAHFRTDDEHLSTEEQHARMRRVSPPSNEVPASVAITAVVGRGEQAAVCVSGFQAYTTGVLFDLAIRLRSMPAGLDHPEVWDLISGSARRGADLERRLLVGVEYPDGRTATTLFGVPSRQQVSSTEPLLTLQGGGGGMLTYDLRLWLSQLPPDGPLTLVRA